MKVYDIISESLILTESKRLFLAMLERLGVTEIDKALAYLGRVAVSSRMSAKEVAESWATAARRTGTDIEDIAVMGERELRAAGMTDADVRKVMAELDKFQPGIFAKINKRLAAVGSKVDSAKAVLGKSFDVVTTIAYKLGIYEPIIECAYDIYTEYSDYSAGKIDQATFQNNSQYWINKCVGRVSAVIVGNYFITKIVSIPGGVPGPTGWKALEGIWKGINQTAQTAFNVWLQTPPGRQALAEFMVADLLFDVPVNVAGSVKMVPVQQAIRDMIGGWTTRFLGMARDQAEKVYDPASADKKKKEKADKAAADQAQADKDYKGFSQGTKYDAYGMPIQSADPRKQITPLN